MAAKLSTFKDNFATASTTKWGGYGTNPSVVAGQLKIVPTAAYPGIYSATTWDFTSSALSVNLVQAPNVGNGTSSITMNVSPSTNNSISILVEGTNLVFRETVANVKSDTSIAYSAVNHKWLRIREASGSVFWDTSPDGLNWTQQRTKSTTLVLTTVTINIFAGFYGTEPTPGSSILDDLNLTVVPLSASGWTVGSSLSAIGGPDGGTVVAKNYYDNATWLWDPIPASPVLDPDSAAISASLASTAGGAQRGLGLYAYASTIVGPTGITAATPRYTLPLTAAYGTYPLSGTVPIPNGTPIPPGSDGHVSFLDSTTNKVYSMWQMKNVGGGTNWSASWGAEVDLHGDGREVAPGSSTASRLARPAGVIRGNEIAALQIPHALFFSSDMCDTINFKYPASKTDGDNAAGVAKPIQQGARIQLDPSIDLAAIPGITPGEIAIGKALQVYGAYCGDKGSSRMAFVCEYVNDGTNPGAVYVNAGLAYDYFDMTHLPWSSLRVLQNYNGM